MTGGSSREQDVDVDLGRLFSSLGRNWLRILVVALAVTAAAFALASVATPKYRAETRILIETRESPFTRPDTTQDSERPILDEEGVTSQVQVITSTDLLKSVAADLKLAERGEFEASGETSTLGRVLVLLGLRSDPGEIAPQERVLEAFREKLSVYRVEKSRVIVIEFSSEDPQLAERVANAVAEAYIGVQRAAKSQSNADATDWLEPEIAQLRNRVRDAERKVADFRSTSDLLIGQNNSVLATQQLSELSTELSRVRASRAAAEATAEGVRIALKDGAAVDTLPSVLESGLIQRLRERQVQLKADIADLSATLLGNHPRIRSLNSQLIDLNAQIRAEGQKVLAGLDNEAKAANFRERQLVADLNRLKAESARAGEEEVELRALEREAASQRDLLESYLARYREASSRGQGNYSPVDARIFSRAIVPSEPYFPKKVPIAAAAFAAALLVMALITLMRELFSGRAMRAAPRAGVERVEEVAMAPVETAAPESSIEPEPLPAVMPVDAPVRAGAPAATAGEVAEMIIARGISRAVFVSPEGDEAAASAVLVAREVADSGLRVLLLDLTLSGAASTPMLEDAHRLGITDLLAAKAQFREVIHVDCFSDCHVIPSGTADPVKAMRAADRLPIILSSLAAAYDVILVECGAADADAIDRLVDEGTEVLISVVEADAGLVEETKGNLADGGYESPLLVSPDRDLPNEPVPDARSAA